ncbi:leukocyte immunoglobulin-like receptor subfamily B member 3 isoform X2 [Phacochoerus africanus]|uniref:leukocyte immunoglobulin-like receptor subfamily B member 3 isoform X2 n=1 Tax=Phacochoerus africanus TaxID=41426 RepID=UPI001FDA45BB|nr:leukocyte immunoglobulin-like receptor subfamily B member 3 isoform X2 [Phacochoerus africanus]
MGGGSTTPGLTALLCLGLCWHPWDQVQAGVLPKPFIWADPAPIVPKGSPVTLWCQGSLQADVYRLYKVGDSRLWKDEAPQDPRNTARFHFESLSSHHAGQYQCAYYSWKGWSRRSDPLALVVTGQYTAPSLSAHPSPVVASGGNVSLSCSSQFWLGTLYLLKEGGAEPPRRSAWRKFGNSGRREALFPVGPVNASHGGTYRCYDSPSSDPYLWSQPSDPLHLQVTGVYREPSLSAQPGSLVLLGDRLTLQCRSDAGFGRFALTKDEGSTPPLRLNSQHSPDFPLGRVSHTRGGRYRCYTAHNLSDAWSAPSAPLDVLIAGMYQKPSLSAHPRTSVSWGENVTLQCRSEIVLDTFHLFKEGSLAPAQSLRLQDMVAPVQANFTLSPMTSAHNETYRCYTSQSTSPYVLSNPSDPLQLLISGGSKDGLMESGLQRGLPWYLSLLIGVSVAFVLLLLLLLFLLIRQRQQQRGQDTHRKSAAASVAKDRGQQKSSSPAADIQEEKLYAVMKHTWLKDGNPRDSQAAESDGPQDVTYAQLNHVTLRQGTTAPPPSQAGEPPAEPSVYATLAIRQPTKDPDPRD